MSNVFSTGPETISPQLRARLYRAIRDGGRLDGYAVTRRGCCWEADTWVFAVRYPNKARRAFLSTKRFEYYVLAYETWTELRQRMEARSRTKQGPADKHLALRQCRHTMPGRAA